MTASTAPLAIDGGTPVRTTPLPSGFIGTRILGKEEQAEVLATLEAHALSRVSGMTPPTRVATFERELCRYTGSPYALAVTSGTAALEVALAALGIGPGDEVIVPAVNFISSPEAVLRLGAIPIFAEVDRGFGIDPGDVEHRITSRTRAIMPLHVHGAACRIDAIVEIAQRRGLLVLENGAWSCGARYHGRAIGTFGDAGIYSLQSVKVITAGEGGVVLMRDPVVYERAHRYHNHGNFAAAEIPASLDAAPDTPTIAPSVESFIGAAYRMPELAGAVALAQLRKIDSLLERTRRAQRAILAGLRELLSDYPAGDAPCTLRDVPDPEGDCGIAVGLIARDADLAKRILAALRAEGIPLGNLYGARPVYALPQMQSLRPVWTNGVPLLRAEAGPPPSYAGSLCPRTEDLMARILMLSVTPSYEEQDVRDVLAAFEKVIRSEIGG